MGKVFKILLWTIFTMVWMFFGMGPPILAVVGFMTGSNVPASSLFLMALYALGMFLVAVITVCWVNEKQST